MGSFRLDYQAADGLSRPHNNLKCIYTPAFIILFIHHLTEGTPATAAEVPASSPGNRLLAGRLSSGQAACGTSSSCTPSKVATGGPLLQ
jgi:hypothetical protein